MLRVRTFYSPSGDQKMFPKVLHLNFTLFRRKQKVSAQFYNLRIGHQHLETAIHIEVVTGTLGLGFSVLFSDANTIRHSISAKKA